MSMFSDEEQQIRAKCQEWRLGSAISQGTCIIYSIFLHNEVSDLFSLPSLTNWGAVLTPAGKL